MAHTDPTDKGGTNPGGSVDDRYERSDARAGAVLAVGGFLFFAAVLTAGAVSVYYKFAVASMKSGQRPISDMAKNDKGREFQGKDNLQISPKYDMDVYRAESLKTLGEYGWISKEAGVVRMPIERSIALVAQRGLPSRPAAESSAFFDQATSAPQDSSGGRTFRNKLR